VTILFWMLAGLMIAAAGAIVLRPLLGTKGAMTPARDALVAAARERLAEIERDLAAGIIEPAAAQAARLELERDLLAATASAEAAPATAPGSRLSAFATAVALALVSTGLYLWLGSPGLVVPPTPEAQLADAIAELEAHLEKNPDDAERWDLLARGYAGAGRFDDAARALERLAAIRGENPDILVREADALARAQGGSLAGAPRALLERSLALDPDHGGALLLAGLADAEAGDYATARDRWRRLLALMENDESAPRGAVEKLIRRAEEELGERPRAAITVRVAVAPDLADQVGEEATVFVVARAGDGTPMPLAVARRPASDLPFEITLDDGMAMMPERRLSDFPAVDITARVSRSGTAEPTSGDLVGSAGNVPTVSPETVEITIDRVVP
jgi:cytochrome c-type biogenesis protein CcmH